jgi:hypothetical protein
VADRVVRVVRGLIVALTVFGCRETDGQRRTPAAPPVRDVTAIGRMADARLREASGLVRSRSHNNVFWSHGDSGNDERVFAFDSTGASLGAPRVQGAKNRDWEALAVGPCEQGECLYIGDVGDNLARRKTASIYRTPEPAPGDTATRPVERLEFAYRDGARDVEAMWVTPDTSVWLLTKRPDKSGIRWRAAQIYRLAPSAWRAKGTVTADLVDSIAIVPQKGQESGWVTDAALSDPDSAGMRRLAIRTYGDVYLFDVDAVTWRPTSLVGKCSLSGLRENRRGEGVTWMADGRLLFNHEGASEPLFAGRCP